MDDKVYPKQKPLNPIKSIKKSVPIIVVPKNHKTVPKTRLFLTEILNTWKLSILFSLKKEMELVIYDVISSLVFVDVLFINKTPIDVLDCRSKYDYIKQYFNTNKKIVFSNVEILIFLVQPEKKTKKKNQHTLKSKPI